MTGLSGNLPGNNLKGKVALMTGASSGIGEATAQRLPLVARKQERLQAL